MTEFSCLRCEARGLGDVRLVEHGTDDMALCKRCFNIIKREAEEATVLDPSAALRHVLSKSDTFDEPTEDEE